MVYGCIICTECLETDPSDDPGIKRPAEAFGSAEAAQAAAQQVARSSRPGPASFKKGRKNITSGAPTDIIVTQCGHVFHRFCIVGWFKDKNTMKCPLCSKACLPSKLVQIFPTVVPDPAPPIDSMQQNRQQTIDVASSGQVVLGRGPIQGTPVPFQFPIIKNVVGNYHVPPNRKEDNNCNDDRDVQNIGGNGGAGRLVPPQQQPLALVKCTRPECVDTAFLHRTLMEDFEDIQSKYATALANLEMQRATAQSYEETIKNQGALIASLHRQQGQIREILQVGVPINEQGVQLGLNHVNPVGTSNSEMDEAAGTQLRTRPSGSNAKEDDSPPKRFRRINDDNPPAGGSNPAIA